MANVSSENRERKPKVEGFALERRLKPYEMLASNDAHERDLAKKVKKAAKEAKRLARRLNKLSEMVSEIDKQRKGGPLLRWLWFRGSEGRADLEDAFAAAVEGRPHKPAPRPWEQKPEGGTALVAGSLANAFEKIVAGTLGQEAASAKVRKGGRPRAVLFNAACRLLAEEGWDDPQIAEKLIMADVASGTLDKVHARVKTTLNRAADFTKPLHTHAKDVEEIVRIQDEEIRRLIAAGRIPARIGGRSRFAGVGAACADGKEGRTKPLHE